MSEIAVLGDELTVNIFKSIGVDIYTVDGDDFRSIFKEVYEKYKIIFLTEPAYISCQNLITSERKIPIITVIPSIVSQKNVGMKLLKKLSILATGSEL